MLNFHPQRWNDSWFPWAKELVWQNAKNQIKRVLVSEIRVDRGCIGEGKTDLSCEMMENFFEQYYWVYILQSQSDNKMYTGYTKNLPSRFEQHQKGLVESTKNRRPLILIYFEGCLNQQDATKREKYLKSHYGKMFLGNRLSNWKKNFR